MSEILSSNQMLPTTFEPQRKNWWVFNLEGLDAVLLKTAARPQMTTESIEIGWISSTRNVAGKRKFGTIALTFHSAIAPSATSQIMEWLRTAYDPLTGRSGYAANYKRNGQIKMLDPMGTVIELWDIYGMFITESNFGELGYDTQDLAEISVTVQPDFCHQVF